MKLLKKIDKFFEIHKRSSSFGIEIMAGITTFLAMSYILIVNPNNILLSGTADPRFSSVFIATALGSFIGTILMALIAKMPFAQAPGMGLNAMVGTIVGGSLGFSYSYGNAMFLIFESGIIFLLLSIIPCDKTKDGKRTISLREKIFEAIPTGIRLAIPVGIGLFITYIGLQNAKLIVDNKFTLTQLVKFNDPSLWTRGGAALSAIVSLFGLIVITICSHYKVKGSVIIGILASTILSIPLGVSNINVLLGKVDGISWHAFHNISSFFNLTNPNSVFLSLFRDGILLPKGSLLTSLMLIVTFSMVDMFDSMGTVYGCSMNANLLDEDDKPINYDKIMYSDSIATLAGSVLGTSTVTTFVESGVGISFGAKTGFSSLICSVMFLLSIFLLPLFAFIPKEAVAGALIYVGFLMMKNIKNIDFNNIKYGIPSFLIIIMMILTYSITDAIGIGIMTFVIIDLIIYIIDYFKYKLKKTEKKPAFEITLTTIFMFIMFAIYFFVPMI